MASPVPWNDETFVGIPAVLFSSEENPSKFRESAAEEGAHTCLSRQARACVTLSWGQIVSTKTRDPAAGHRPRTAANYRRAPYACLRERELVPEQRTDSDESRGRGGEFVAFQVRIVTLLQIEIENSWELEDIWIHLVRI